MAGVENSIVTHVEVNADPGGHLVVSWSVEGAPIAVDVAVGPTPDRLEHAHALTMPVGASSATLSDLGAGRHFVSVAPHESGPALVAADRRVNFEGITNFRDLGGYRTRSGGHTRWGMVFRADALHGLSERDIAVYERLGLRTIYDLRGDLERQERPNPFESRSVPFVGRPPDAPPLLADPAVTVEDGERYLHALYVGLIEHAALQIGELLAGLASAAALPAVFHCHAGKDRTGVAAALLLELLGVERETVLDDYELTTRYRYREQQEGSFQRLVERGMSPEAAAGVLTAPRWAMGEVLEELDGVYGGVEPYLLGFAGMERSQIDTLRHLLVTTH